MSNTVKSLLEQKGRQVFLLTGEESLLEAAQILGKNKVGCAIIQNGAGGVAGIFSERDVIAHLHKKGAEGLSTPVKSIMTTSVQCLTESDTTDAVMKKMTNGRFRHMPVLKGDQLVGIISIGDVVKHRMEEMENEVNAMRDYIVKS